MRAVAARIPIGIDTLSASPPVDAQEHRLAFERARVIHPHDKSVGWVGSHAGLHYFVRGRAKVFTVPVSDGWVGRFSRG